MINFKKFSKNVGRHKINLVDTKLKLYTRVRCPTSSFIYKDHLRMFIGCNNRPYLSRKDINNKEYIMKPWGN